MHGIKQQDFYKNHEEGEAFKAKLEKGYKLLDAFVDYCSKMQTNGFVDSFLKHISDSDTKMFKLSSAIIEFMPEFTPSWNYRKKYIMSRSSDKKVLVESLMDERLLTQKSLKGSPKSYSIWHHRLWTMSFLFNLKVENLSQLLLEEYKLCFKLFNFDARNFHCWSYLNYVRHYFMLLNTGTDMDTIFSQDILNLINENFSNHSAWFYKSNLPDKNISTSQELELVKQVLYTEPKDQSLWNYYNWLLFKKNAVDHYLVYVSYLDEKKQLNLYFNSPVKLEPCSSGFYKKGRMTELNNFLDDLKVKGNWKLSNLKFGFGYIWKFEFESDHELDKLSKLELVFLLNNQAGQRFYSNLLTKPIYMSDNREHINSLENFSDYVQLKLIYYFTEDNQVNFENFKVFERDNNKNWVENNRFEKPFKLRNELVCLGRNITFETLKEQLEVIDELISFDGESKYLLIARLKLLDYLGKDEEFESLFQKLAVLDPLRKHYYHEMSTKYKARSEIRRMNNSLNLNLSNMSLSNLEFNNLSTFYGFTHLDLSNNKLSYSSISNVGCFLLLLESLDLSENGLTSLIDVVKLLSDLPRLKRLNLSSNPLKVVSCKHKLDSQLSEIDLSDTPICDYFASEGLEGGLESTVLFAHYSFNMYFDKQNQKTHLYLYKIDK